MRLIIAGSRHLQCTQSYLLELMCKYNLHPTEIVSGMANGVDECGYNFGKYYLQIPVTTFPANWSKYGKIAGPMRNSKMAEYADVLLLIWDGISKGSADMKRQMLTRRKPIYEEIISKG